MNFCFICETRERLIELLVNPDGWHVYLCKTCLAIAAALEEGDTLGHGRLVVKAEANAEGMQELSAHLDNLVVQMEGDEAAEIEEVEIIASGYEWICPNCEYPNTEIEATEFVVCKSNCGKRFRVADYYHATG